MYLADLHSSFTNTHTTDCVTLREMRGSSEPVIVHAPKADMCTVHWAPSLASEALG